MRTLGASDQPIHSTSRVPPVNRAESGRNRCGEPSRAGPNKAASANIETVFSGAGRFSKEAESASPSLLRSMVRLHYAWKYPFLRPPNKEIVDRYNKKHHGALHAMLARQAEAGKSMGTPAAQAPEPEEASSPQVATTPVATEALRESGVIGREMIEGEEAVEAAAQL